MSDHTPLRQDRRQWPDGDGCCERREPVSLAQPKQQSPARPWLQRAGCCEHREPIMRVDDLAVRYGGTPALRGVTMPIHRGCITAVIGSSGCGKSTFMSCLNRLTDLIPACTVTGGVSLDGHDVLDPRIDLIALRRRVGMIFQKPNPFPLSICKNLTLPLRQHGVRDGDLQMHKAVRNVTRLFERIQDFEKRVVKPREAHIENLDNALFVQQQIGGLDVAMHHAFAVGVFEPAGRLKDVIDGLVDGQGPLALHEPGQIAAVDEFHHQEVNALRFAGVERGNDVRVN